MNKVTHDHIETMCLLGQKYLFYFLEEQITYLEEITIIDKKAQSTL